MDKDKEKLQFQEVLQSQARGESWEAMKKLKELAVKDPQNAFYQKLLGNIYFHMGLLDWAIDYYQKAVKIGENYIDAYYDLGVSYYHRGKIKFAITEFERALQLDPEYHAAHYRLGICYQHVGSIEKATHHFIESTIVTPEYVMAHFHLAEIYYEMGELDKAENSCEKVLEENSEDKAGKNLLAKIKSKK